MKPATVGAALALFLVLAAATAEPAQRPKITYFSVVRTGPTWVALEWNADGAARFALRYRRAGGKWQAVEGIEGYSYSVAGLAPDQQYQFRLNVPSSTRPAALSSIVSARTSPVESIAWEGLSLWPQWRFLRAPITPALDPAPPVVAEGAAIETYGGYIYVLEAAGSHLLLSRLDPASCDRLDAYMLARSEAAAQATNGPAAPSRTTSALVASDLPAQWTVPVTPPVDEPLAHCANPDTCVLGDRLWFTWEASPADVQQPGVAARRQRLAFFDLSGDLAAMSSAQAAARVSAPLQIVPGEAAVPVGEAPSTNPTDPPSVALRGTMGGRLAAYRDALWIAWTEAWDTGVEGQRGRLMLARYEPQRGCLEAQTVWAGCPSADPRVPSIGRLDADLQILFADAAAEEQTPGLAPLMSARFDGRRFYDVRTLRRMGRSLAARGLQLADRFYFAYQTDASYQVSGGAYSDIALGWLPAGAPGLLATIGASGDAQPYATDMKRNTLPDVGLLAATDRRQERLFVCYCKADDPPGTAAGTYIGRITPAVTGFLSD